MFWEKGPELKDHLGGGTPTFFSPENLDRLISGIMDKLIELKTEFSFEAHPNNTSRPT